MDKLLSELTATPVGCTCIAYSQDFSKGYVVINRCEVCESIQAAQNEIVTKERRKVEIVQELNALDLQAIRPILDNEADRIAEIQAAKQALRAELASLQ